MRWDEWLKRVVDFILASAGLLISSPMWLLVPLAIKLDDGGPVFFAQERWGQGGRRIRVLKFRTMVVDANPGGITVQATPDDPRITRIGRWLRANGLDELPQVWSIWKGEMSFVGPRALPVNEIPSHGQDGYAADWEIPRFRERLAVKPGLTGIAQVYAARDVARRRKFRYDTFYIRRRTLQLDLRLIAFSLWISVRGQCETRGSRSALERRPGARRCRRQGAVGRDGKIVRVIARLNVGGPAIHVVLLNAGLKQLGFKPILVTGREGANEGSMLPYATARGVRPVLIPEMAGDPSAGVNDLRALIKLYALMRRERPLIVHSHTGKAGMLARIAAWAAGVPIVVHTFHGHVLRGYYGPLKTWLLRQMERALGRWTDCIVAVSEGVKRELVEYGVSAAGRIEVIPLGIDLEPFLAAIRHGGKFRASLGIQPGSPLIGIVGRIVPIKDHRLFLEAARYVAARHPGARFAIVGDGVLRGEIKAYARALGLDEQATFVGWWRDVPEVYADLDVLVISSRNEGTPVAAIEAMAAGCPVVATAVGGVPDLVEDGVTGLLVPPGDAAGLGEAVLTMLGDPELVERMTRAARAKVRRDFVATRLISDTAALYRRLSIRKGYAVDPAPEEPVSAVCEDRIAQEASRRRIALETSLPREDHAARV
jgi:lipopolysaccharide/colanic/teichoic acid biosynthesis glycosyltransferase/glycosyltransferase involved in cell wall biosynthesis